MNSKKERYMQLKHEILGNCGQCMGFRAKGVNLTDNSAKPACAPSVDCHKSCPALGLGGGAAKRVAQVPVVNQVAGGNIAEKAKVAEGRAAQGIGVAPGNIAEGAAQQRGQEKSYIAQSCHRCGKNEDRAVLFPCRALGKSLWVCARCLPALIHG